MQQPGRTVTIIGAGPAGLMAAEVLAQAGATVTVYDRMPSPGRKFLMAGRGGLNLTHVEPLPTFLSRYGQHQDRLAPLIDRFPPDALRAWSASLGQETFVGTSGRVFPHAMKASPLLRAWLARLRASGVRIVAGHRFTGWAPDGALRLEMPDGATTEIYADATVLACGGASWPRLGSDGAWANILEARGLGVSPLRAANSGALIPWSAHFAERFHGHALKTVKLTVADQARRGDLVVTRRGLEGGALYALGALLRRQLDDTGIARLSIDLKPDLSIDALRERLARVPRGQSMANLLRKAAGLSPVAISLLREGQAGALPREPAELAAALKTVPLAVTGLDGLARAISTEGGLAWHNLDDALMLHALPGTFAAGEMLDWDAPTGGYLMQACFATGHAAGASAARWLGLSAGQDAT